MIEPSFFSQSRIIGPSKIIQFLINCPHKFQAPPPSSKLPTLQYSTFQSIFPLILFNFKKLCQFFKKISSTILSLKLFSSKYFYLFLGLTGVVSSFIPIWEYIYGEQCKLTLCRLIANFKPHRILLDANFKPHYLQGIIQKANVGLCFCINPKFYIFYFLSVKIIFNNYC